MRYASIRELDISNGEGVGVALFVQGCHFHCKNCFNAETWDFNGGKEWTEEVENNFLKLIDRPYITRISILGGEPLANENVEEICSLIKKINSIYPDKKIWLYTGYILKDIIDKFNEYKYTPFSYDAEKWLTRYESVGNVDIVIDGRYDDNKKDFSLKFRGSSNQRIIDVHKSLEQNQVILYDN